MIEGLPAESPYFIERIHADYRDRFTVIWLMTRKCNFLCDYCYQPEGEMTPFEIDDFIAKLKELPQPIRIQITGGEPLIFPWMIEVCQKIGKIGGIIEFQTNFSLRTREFLDNVNPKDIELILISYHPVERERVIKNGIKKLIDDIHYAESKGFAYMIWHIDDPRISPEQYLADCKILYDAGITVVKQRYTGNEGGGQIGNAIYVPGKLCRAGWRSMNVWENFDITPCDHDRTALGNLFTGYKLYDEPKHCQMSFCGCLGRELLIDTYYDEYYKREYGG